MAAIQSPATILTLFKKAKTTYQKKPPDPKSKPELRHQEIVKDLGRLRQMAQKKDTAGPALAKPFAARKKLLLKKMAEHRRKLDAAKEKDQDANKSQLPAYLKAMNRLTVAVLKLDYATVTAAEETNIHLDGLEEGDPAELAGLENLSADDLRALEQEDSATLPETDDEGAETDGETPSSIPVPPPQPETKRPPPAVSGVAVVKRLLELTNPCKQAIARKGPQAARMQTLYDQARTAVDAKDFAKAGAALDALEPLLAAPTEGTAPKVQPAVSGVAVVKRLLALATPLKEAVAQKSPAGAKLQALDAKARTLVDAKDFAGAAAVLDELEPMLTGGTKEEEEVETEQEEPEVEVKPGEAAKAWQTARTKVQTQVTALQAALRRLNDPDLRFIADRGARKLSKQFQGGLEDALTEFDKSTAENRKQARDSAAALLQKFQAFLQQDPSLNLMDTNPFGVKVTIRGSLRAALKGVDKALNA
jgi:hypothetical protein